jgi:steroid 5-alpha reductase family enzyme
MTALYLEALVAIAAQLPVLMAGAWVVQQWTGNSGWVAPARSSLGRRHDFDPVGAR